MVRENGRDRLLLDPLASLPSGNTRSINSYSPSPNGKLVAINLAEGGGEIGTTRFYDVATGKPLRDSLGPIWGGDAVNWIDESTVSYVRLTEGGSPKQQLENNTGYLHTSESQPAPTHLCWETK